MDKIHINSLQTTYDYIILGAGISGLQAADILAQRPELKFLVFEAQSCVGGRIGSVRISQLQEASKVEWVSQNSEKIKDALVEKGATWIEDRHVVIKELCKRFGISLIERYFEGSTTFLNKDQPLNQEELIKDTELVEAIKRVVEAFDVLSDQYNKVVYSDLSLSTPQAKEMLRKYQKMTLMDFFKQQIPEHLPFVYDIFDTFLEHSECMSAAENSMHEVLTKNAKSNDIGVLKEFLGTFESEPCYVVNGGTDLITSGFVASIEKKTNKSINEILKLNHQVLIVDNRPKNHITIFCRTEGGVLRKYRCKQVICAVPIGVSRNISFENISKAKRLIIDNQMRTSCKKSLIITKKPFWRRDANGQHCASGDGLLSREYPVNVTVDLSPPDQSCGIMLFFQCGSRLAAWESTFFEEDYEKKKNYLVDLQCKMFKVKPEDKESIFEGCFYSECSYMTNPFIRSGFQSLTRPGTFSEVLDMGDSLEALYRDENGITFIGSEYSLQFGTFMEGAVRVARQKVYKLIGVQDPWAHLIVENVLIH